MSLYNDFNKEVGARRLSTSMKQRLVFDIA